MAVPPGTPTSSASSPDRQQGGVAEPVDWHGLVESFDDDEAFVRELALTYIDSGDRLLAELRAAAERGDCDTVRSTAHALKGASANIRAGRVADAAARLEAAARAGESDRLQALATPLERDFAATVEYLRRKASPQ